MNILYLSATSKSSFNVSDNDFEDIFYLMNKLIKELDPKWGKFKIDRFAKICEWITKKAPDSNIFFKNILRNSNAAFPEMAGFTKMKIGGNQGFFFFPINNSVGGKP